ncbi:MAG: ATP-dependent DNA ligase [Candidatus Caldarchaeum sp.]|jgi:DNA ligase-1
MPRLFSELADLCEKLESTSSRKEKISLIADFLGKFSPEEADEAAAAANLLVGLSSGVRKLGINIGPATLMKALREQQSVLTSPTPLTVSEVWESIEKAASLSGKGVTEARKALLSSLLNRADEKERKWLTRILMGEMRHGASVGILVESLSKYLNKPLDDVKTAEMALGRLDILVKNAIKNRLKETRLQLFSPVKPMLAEYAYSLGEIFEKLGPKVYLEPKIDGVRLQVHVRDGAVKVYTRGLKDVTESVPDIVENVRQAVNAESCILDGEGYCVDENGRATPFQETMRRIGREKNVEEALKQLVLSIKFFDIIHLNGEDLWNTPLHSRRKRLEETVDQRLVNPLIVSGDEEDVRKALEQWTSVGYEGVMAKSPDSPYTPGRRGGYWLKMKKAFTLDVVVVAAEWGHGRRRGWLSNYHLAVLDDRGGGFAPVGKTFKGLTDDEFRKMTHLLLGIAKSHEEWGVVVEPRIVVEIEFNEVQRSPSYTSGYALRFARIKAVRTDKKPEEANTLSDLEKIYNNQRNPSGTHLY